jgi:hypothetical protein
MITETDTVLTATGVFAVTLAVVIAAILSLFLFHVREHYATPERLGPR